MSWNYRVIRSVDRDGTEMYAIHEMYYGPPDGPTADPVPVLGESLDDLRGTLEKMAKALYEPILNMTDFS
jgi:hypothetical protein